MGYLDVLFCAELRLEAGYARDLVLMFTKGPDCGCTSQDADSLFRSLMLDEGWLLGDAERVWSAAWEASELASESVAE